jgi:1-acyl-sn-glycerol-3-phosphate acyltransferase
MLIGSPARALLRIIVYAALTLPLLPFQLLGVLAIPPLARWLPIPYHRAVCWILGIKVKVNGRMVRKRPTLFVVNHVSYLDIEVLGGLIPGSFVAKKEVATWPFFSILAKLQRSVFIDRRMTATKEGQEQMFRRLSQYDNLILFPEGTSGDGTRVLPFRSALFAVAQVKNREGKLITVQPVSLSYTRLDGIPLGRHWRPFYTWFGDMEMAPHLWQMAGLGEVEVLVNFHEPVSLADFADRKALAEHCFKVVYEGVAASNSGRVELLPEPRQAA